MGDTITITKTKARRQDFSDVTSPVVRWDELLPNAVISGGITTAGAGLVGTITAVAVIIDGRRVTVAETAKTFTANKDTYVDVTYSEDSDGVNTGALAYSEVATGNAEPTLAAAHIRLMRVATGATSISSVVDFRALNQGFGMGANVGI